jgi:glycosyltransferase involved in cell wall biosynthesis
MGAPPLAREPAAGAASHGRATAILRGEPLLLAAYMLGPGASLDWSGLNEESAARFLLRFAMEGRRGLEQAVFSPEYLAFLADSAPPFATRLAAYAFLRDRRLRNRFGRDIAAFEAWFASEGALELGLGPFVPARERVRFARTDGPPWIAVPPLDPKVPPAGINLIGFAGGVMGLGEDIRALAAAALRAGLHVAIVDMPLEGRRVTSRPHGWDGLVTDRPMFSTSIFCLPPFEMMRLRLERGPGLFAAPRNIGCWPWELTSLPDECRMAFDLVDEIWAISPFLADVWRGLTRKPVRHLPPHVQVDGVEPADRAAYGLGPDQTVILSMLDLNSYVARKNPEGSIAAFRIAFPDRRGPERLLVKTLNGAAQPDLITALTAAADSDPRVVIVDGALSRAETLGLIAAADVFLSLHRAEGFGRVPAEAMLLGVPVVATGWSGVMSYLDETTGWPVPYALRPPHAGEYPYAAGSMWAEPDIPAAADVLRAALRSPGEASRRADAARLRIRERHSSDAVGLGLRRLLEVS